MSEYNVVVKFVKPIRVASRRESIPEFSAIGSAMDCMYKEVVSYIDEHNGRIAGPGITVWHGALDAEAALPVEQPYTFGSCREAKWPVGSTAALSTVSARHTRPFAGG